jgi:hypothetical protein
MQNINCPVCKSDSILKNKLEQIGNLLPCTCYDCGHTFTIRVVPESKSNLYGEDSPIGPQHFDHNQRFFSPK